MTSLATAKSGIGLCLVAFALATPHPARAQANCADGAPPLVIYHAGSLTAAFKAVERLFTQQTGACITDVPGGSLDAARRITAGQKPVDIYAAADYLDINLFLKPAGYADYNIVFAQGGMVLAYTTASHGAATISAGDAPFDPPNTVPAAAADWYDQLTQTGVLIGDSNPFLDPTGYRVDMMFQLAARYYGMPILYDTLLNHYTLTRPTDALGANYDYQFLYESSAFTAYKANPSIYRYVRLPPAIGLSDPRYEFLYNQVSTVVTGLGIPGSAAKVKIPGSRVAWGITVLRTARHPVTAVRFLQLLLSPQGVALQAANGPAPVSPPLVSDADYDRLPRDLKPLVAR